MIAALLLYAVALSLDQTCTPNLAVSVLLINPTGLLG